MMIPEKIEIQIINKAGHPNPINNLLFGLKIYNNKDSWYNFSPFRSNPDGKVLLTRLSIIINASIIPDENDLEQTEFEIYVWKGQQTDSLIFRTRKSLINMGDDDFIRQDLIRHGVDEKNIADAITITKNKKREEEIFYELIKDAPNNSVQIQTQKIEGIWSDNSPKIYEFIIE